jgi:hypothetical protein
MALIEARKGKTNPTRSLRGGGQTRMRCLKSREIRKNYETTDTINATPQNNKTKKLNKVTPARKIYSTSI